MLRFFVIGYGLLCLLGAVVLLLLFHAALWLIPYLAINGLIMIGAPLLERKRYASPVDRTRAGWQATDERFIDPTTGQLMQVFYHRATGERDYRAVREPN
jgi:hypothetical protein